MGYKIHHENISSGNQGQDYYDMLAKIMAISFFKIAKTEREAGFLLTFVKDTMPGLKLIDDSFDEDRFIKEMEKELEMLEKPWLRNLTK